jgi:hypothetical protein
MNYLLQNLNLVYAKPVPNQPMIINLHGDYLIEVKYVQFYSFYLYYLSFEIYFYYVQLFTFFNLFYFINKNRLFENLIIVDFLK